MKNVELIQRLLGEVYSRFENFMNLPHAVIFDGKIEPLPEITMNNYLLGYIHGLLLAIKIAGEPE